MKDDLHKDNLEEFLRKSLEGHSEEPPGDLWSKIATNLDAPVADLPSVAPKLRVLRSWWSVAAAAAVVTGLLVGQHFYFSGKIEHLNEALERNAVKLKELEQKRITEQQTLPIEAVNESQAVPQNVTTTETASSSKELQNAPQLDETIKQRRPINNSTNQFSKDKKRRNGGDGNTVPPAYIASQNDMKSSGNMAEQKTGAIERVAGNIETPVAATGGAAAADAPIAKQPEPPKTWGRKLTPLVMPEPTTPTVASIVPTSFQQGTRFSVGLQTMPMATKAEIHRVKPEPGPGGPGPGGGFDKHKSFNAREEMSFRSWSTGLAIEMKATPRLRIGTGVSYRSLNNETTHEICLDFRDREHGPGPHNQHEHDFQYNLNTAFGSVEMTVRAESDDPATSISDTAKVEGTLKTTEHLAFASVPMYANYSFGKGRLRVLAKAGLVFNFLLDSGLEVEDIDSPQNSRFRFDKQKPQNGSPADLQTLTASYMAGLGLEYQVSKSLSLRAEPTVMGSLTSLHNNPYIESSEISAGLNVGVMYSF